MCAHEFQFPSLSNVLPPFTTNAGLDHGSAALEGRLSILSLYHLVLLSAWYIASRAQLTPCLHTTRNTKRNCLPEMIPDNESSL